MKYKLILLAIVCWGLSACNILTSSDKASTDDNFLGTQPSVPVPVLAEPILSFSSPGSSPANDDTPTFQVTLQGGVNFSATNVLSLHEGVDCSSAPVATVEAGSGYSGVTVTLTLSSAITAAAHDYHVRISDGASTPKCSPPLTYTYDSTVIALTSVTVHSVLTVDVLFSGVVVTGATTAANYALSGTGTGTLSANPDSVALVSGNTYRLTWNSGQMVDGGDITIAVSNAIDGLGNIISASGTHTGGATAPTLAYGNGTGVRGTSLSSLSPTATAGTGATIPGAGSYAITSGTLPTGLSLNANTGVITGTPTAVQAATSYTVTLTNSVSQTAPGTFTIEVTEEWVDSNGTSALGALLKKGVEWIASKIQMTNNGGCNATLANCSELDETWTPQWGSLIGYWKMNGNWDNSLGTVHGIPQGNASFMPSNRMNSHAGNFDGAGDYVDGGLALDPSGVNKMSMAVWVKSNNGNTLHNIGGWFDGSNGIFLHSKVTGQGLLVLAGGGSSFGEVDFDTVSGWVHAVLVYDGTLTGDANRLKLYANGVLQTLNFSVGGIPAVLPTVSPPSLRIGDLPGYNRFWNGQIDDYAIWTTALTADEVKSIYSRQVPKFAGYMVSRVMDNLSARVWSGIKWVSSLPFYKELPDAACAPPCAHVNSETTANYSELDNGLMAGIQGLWHFNETTPGTGGAGNDFLDTSGKGNHLTATGSIFDRTGVFNKAIGFSAAGDNAKKAAATSLGLAGNVGSFSAWIKTNGDTGNYQSIMMIYTGASFPYQIYLEQGTLNLNFYSNGAGISTTSVPVTPKVWHHIAVTITGSTGKYYIDGKLVNTIPTPLSGFASGTFEIGNYSIVGSRQFNGPIDEVGIWSRVLTDAEILHLYRRGVNRLKLQVRACTTADCSDNPAWQGADGGITTTISELHNNSAVDILGIPTGAVQPAPADMNFVALPGVSLPTRQFFQYQILMESEDANSACAASTCFPNMESVTVKP